MTQTKEDQINEIGDLLYHLTVLMVEKGISMEDVNAELERRAQKTHNLEGGAKADRTFVSRAVGFFFSSMSCLRLWYGVGIKIAA